MYISHVIKKSCFSHMLRYKCHYYKLSPKKFFQPSLEENCVHLFITCWHIVNTKLKVFFLTCLLHKRGRVIRISDLRFIRLSPSQLSYLLETKIKGIKFGLVPANWATSWRPKLKVLNFWDMLQCNIIFIFDPYLVRRRRLNFNPPFHVIAHMPRY